MARYALDISSNESGNGYLGLANIDPRPFSGVFGDGKIRFFLPGVHNFIVPARSLRVRLWSAGGQDGGGGAGFSMKILSGLTIGAIIQVTAAPATGLASSFGTYLSATGGGTRGEAGTSPGQGGMGVNGDINFRGGNSNMASAKTRAGGSAATLFGNGSDGGATSGTLRTGGTSSTQSLELPIFFGQTIDLIGTGRGGTGYGVPGTNGGGGGGSGETNLTTLRAANTTAQ